MLTARKKDEPWVETVGHMHTSALLLSRLLVLYLMWSKTGLSPYQWFMLQVHPPPGLAFGDVDLFVSVYERLSTCWNSTWLDTQIKILLSSPLSH